jgi:sialidase-1
MNRLRLIAWVAMCALPAVVLRAAPAEVEFKPVFTAGEEGYACYRIPAMVTTAQGTILAVADGRLAGCNDIPNPLDLVLKRSHDQGRTWSPLQVIAGYGKDTQDTDVYPACGITNPIPRVSAGDAALVFDRTRSRVWVLYDNGGSASQRPHQRAIKLELRFSDDDGATWSDAIDLEASNPALRPAGVDFLAGPGNGIQLTRGPHAGRLVFAVYLYGTPYYSSVIFSDDHGASWRRGGNAGAGGGEIQVAETSEGQLLATIRHATFPKKGVRYFNRSPDGGESWGEPYFETAVQPALPDPGCQASLLRLTAPGRSTNSVLVLAHAAEETARVKLTLRFSHDRGRTWGGSRLVYPGPAAYSALTELGPEEIGLLAELDDYKRIGFARLPTLESRSGR